LGKRDAALAASRGPAPADAVTTIPSEAVLPVLPPLPAGDAGTAGLPLAAWTRAVAPSSIQEMMGLMARPGVISFALGLPAPELFPVEEYAEAARRALADPSSLQYRTAWAPLRAEVARLMERRGVRCRPEQVFLTTAAQQALALLTRLLLEPGGTVVCDSLVYMGFQQALEPYAPRVLAVPTDLRTGMDVDAVEALLAAGERPAFVYCITDGHNPLGASLSAPKRARLAELARRYRVPVLEDDAYGLVDYGGGEPPLRALEERWVLYVGSFSKVLAPGFRVGWIVAPEELVPLLGCAKDGMDLDTSTFSQRLVAEYLASGRFPAHLETVRAEYRARRDLMLALLERHFPAGTRWSIPRHGSLVWAELPGGRDAAALLAPALEAGVAYVPGSVFAVPGSGAGRSGLRLNFSYPPQDAIRVGMERLGRVFR
jgi:2-aminoadipate transaminase